MEYIILDKDGELIDVLDLTSAQVKAYKFANPSHMVKEASEDFALDEVFLVDSDDDLDNTNLDMDDDSSLW